MYKIKEKIKILSDGFPGPQTFLRDDESVDAEELHAYFDRSFGVFEDRLITFRTSPSISEAEAKELRFMLEALIAAKEILAEEV
jgi:hypothetical protein